MGLFGRLFHSQLHTILNTTVYMLSAWRPLEEHPCIGFPSTMQFLTDVGPTRLFWDAPKFRQQLQQTYHTLRDKALGQKTISQV